MDTSRLVDENAQNPVLVFGSLPPSGRDLDVLVHDGDRKSISAALRAQGFVSRGVTWARFEGCSADAVDVVPASEWRLPAAALDALWSDSRPLEGFARLVRPAPHHALVILARRVVYGDGIIDAKRLRRLEVALHEDFQAFRRAREVAPDWGLFRAVSELEGAYRTGLPVRNYDRAAAIAEHLAAQGVRNASLRGLRSATRTSGRPRVVALSGLDGSGKTSQAEALRDTLVRLGIDAVVVWAKLSRNPSLDWVARPVKLVLAIATRTRSGASMRDRSSGDEVGRNLRAESRSLSWLWATIVALANGLTQRRIVRYHLRRGRAVVCDRYILDSAVHLRYRYGVDSHFGFQLRLIRMLSPAPLRAFLLDIPGDLALARKNERYRPEEIAVQARLYREEHEALGVIRLDGTRPRDELCAEIAKEVWLNL